MESTRRTFLGTLLAACLAGAGLLLRAGAAAAKKVAIDLSKLSSLKDVGGSAVVSIKKKKILFIRTSEDRIAALNPECTHQKCAVQYKKKWGEIRCSCHGSKFTTSGKVLSGPAEKDLKSYPTTIEDGKLIVKI
ncbi:MAG: Rieske (2Fe-2S) protein [Deltaproteobacteria bacterium]|nr:Rieske (2Fe-2S) protein [Deltaproteobacteria bacterium]